MRFAIASTALLFANCGASIDDEPANNRMVGIESEAAATNQRISLPGSTQSGNQKGPHQRQLRNPTVKKLLRRLAEKKLERATKVANTESEGDEVFSPDNDANLALPDLGVIGRRNREKGGRRRRASDIISDRAGKESIMDKNSIRESIGDEMGDGISSPINDATSSPTNVDTEPLDYEPLNEYNSFVFDTLQYYCKELADEEGLGLCDCGNFDFESGIGTIECSNYVELDGSAYCQSTINYCGEPVEICYRGTTVLESSGPENYSYTTCYTYTEPYQQHVCITFDHTTNNEDSYEPDTNTATVVSPYMDGWYSFTNPSSFPCSVQFNNMECNSCSTEIRTYQQNSVDEDTGESEVVALAQERCFQIDCSNTGDETNILNTCDDRPFPTTLRENVVFGDDCTRCQPCGLGYRMQNPEAEGSFPLIGEYQCSGLELAAKVGFFDRNMCPEVQAKTAEFCGCEALFYDSALVPTSPRTVMTSTSFPDSYTSYTTPPVVLLGNTFGDKACDVCGNQKAIVANPDNIVTLPNGVQTSCSALQGAGRLGMFTSDYCRSNVMPLVFQTCGGCFHEQDVNIVGPGDILAPSFRTEGADAATEDHNQDYSQTNPDDFDSGKEEDGGVKIVVSRMDGEEFDQKHRERPDEIDVETDSSSNDNGNDSGNDSGNPGASAPYADISSTSDPNNEPSVANELSAGIVSSSGSSSQLLTRASKTWMLVTTAMVVPCSLVVVYFS